MTKDAFLTNLREGMASLPPRTVAELMAGYDARFDAALADGLTEAEAAERLGSPGRLAAELAAEVSAAPRVASSSGDITAPILGLVGLAAVDLMILAPVLVAATGVLCGLAMASVGVFLGGGALFAVGPFASPPGGPFAAILAGLGLMAGAVCLTALLSLAAIGLAHLLVRYGRLHYRLVRRVL